MTNEKRQEIEKRIVTRIVRDALSKGFLVRVHDGEEFATGRLGHGSEKEVLAAMFSTDADYLYFYRAGEARNVGTAVLIYGNDGYDVLADHTVNDAVTDIISRAVDLAEELEKLHG